MVKKSNMSHFIKNYGQSGLQRAQAQPNNEPRQKSHAVEIPRGLCPRGIVQAGADTSDESTGDNQTAGAHIGDVIISYHKYFIRPESSYEAELL